MINTVIEGDCLDVMKSMPDKCVDLVLTDPPYGLNSTNFITARTKKKNQRYEDKKWNNSIPDKIYFDEIRRVSKNQIIWGCNYFYPNIPEPGRIVHNKVMTSKDGPLKLSDCDLASQTFDRRVMMYTYQWSGNVMDGKINWLNTGPDARVHPTQKPIALMSWCLNNYTHPGMTIFDPFAGSGTTAIACLETGRNYILVEKEPEYVKIINKRIEVWKEQGRLFPAHVV